MPGQLKYLLDWLKSNLDGKKTYLLAIAAIAHGLASDDYQEVWAGLIAITGRSAIAKT